MLVALVVVAFVLLINSSGSRFSAQQAKSALSRLPFRIVFSGPEGSVDHSVFVGRASGQRGAVVEFSVGTNSHRAPPIASLGDAEGLYTSDFELETRFAAPQRETKAQIVEHNRMAGEIEEALCRASSGKPCGP